jgi:hypothetical protein
MFLFLSLLFPKIIEKEGLQAKDGGSLLACGKAASAAFFHFSFKQ